MTTELHKAYQPKDIESGIYAKWERSGFFNPDKMPSPRKKSFTISMPPPNVTGELHLGHATGLTIQDIMTRYHRMKGDRTLCLPGTDHAGISTQVMVERLIASEGVNRDSLGRAEFLKRVWQWKKKYGSRITTQVRQLGISCDWSREHFTMDPALTAAVHKAFITLFNEGLIYRGSRIVNWCPRCATALSDLEVKHVETSGKLWFIRYPLSGSTKYIVVATTRPETMLGDTAVAVNPKDKRYAQYVGKKIILPIVNREIPIVADARVDMEFGTGAVKVTPAHDAADYAIGLDHRLPAINIIGQDNTMTKEAGEYYGKSVQDARHDIFIRLEDEELVEKTVDYIHQQARCDRCSTPIEPLISKQWFLKIAPLAKPAISAVKSGKINIIPKRFEKVYFHWMNNIHDWCISRQLWWGHQIPVWYCQKCQEPAASSDKPKACKKCRGKQFKQEEDTLDTWFSSGLWTFSTLGWPKKTKDLKLFHPTSVMETGWDLLFFWVARMVMLSLHFTHKVPFKTIYLHGMVLDKHGKKMSKSKGTGIDPILMTEKYGTDAIRLSLVLGTAPGLDYRLYEEKIAGYRNFINKLWNVARFTLSQPAPKTKKLEAKTLADTWIMGRLNQLVADVTKNIDNFKFSEAGTALYDFLWHDFADWYLEIAKHEKNYGVLRSVLTTWLKLAHPFIPFVTEEIWSRLAHTGKNNMLIVQAWPHPDKKTSNNTAKKEFAMLQEFVTAARNIRTQKKEPASDTITAHIQGKGEKLILKNKKIISQLAKIDVTTKNGSQMTHFHAAGVNCWLELSRGSAVDLERQTRDISSYIQRLEEKLSNKNFTERAPKDVVDRERQKLAEAQEKLKKLL
ncbi:MAG: valine--tRNA ligase [Patescibacteria group bacterium]